MQYLLGAGGSASEGGGHAAGVFDELRPMLLSIGPLLEMDSNMTMTRSYSDTIGCQRQTRANPRQNNSQICSVMFG